MGGHGFDSWLKNSRGEWYVVVQVLLLALVVVAPHYETAAWTGAWSAAVFVAGGGLMIGGLALAFAGVLSLGRNLTPLPRPRDDAALVERGAYSVVRHPIYGGLALAAFGWALLWRSPLTLWFAAILLVFFDIKARREERWLEQRFPHYDGYRRRVKKLIPFVY